MANTRSGKEPRTPERNEKMKGKADSSDESTESDEPVLSKQALKGAQEDAKRRLAQLVTIQARVGESKEQLARRIAQSNARTERALKRSMKAQEDRIKATQEQKPSKSGSGKSVTGKKYR